MTDQTKEDVLTRLLVENAAESLHRKHGLDPDECLRRAQGWFDLILASHLRRRRSVDPAYRAEEGLTE